MARLISDSENDEIDKAIEAVGRGGRDATSTDLGVRAKPAAPAPTPKATAPVITKGARDASRVAEDKARPAPITKAVAKSKPAVSRTKYKGGRTEADIDNMISDADTQARKGSNSEPLFKKGGKAKKYANGGSVGRGDGCASKGKTRCKFI